MPRDLTRAEKRALHLLPIARNPTDRLSNSNPGRNPLRKIAIYRADEAKFRERRARTERTHEFAKFVLLAAEKSGGVAPYAFQLPNGDPSSLDWGCVGFLYHAGELGFSLGAGGYVDGVRPTAALRAQYPDYAQVDAASALQSDLSEIVASSVAETERVAMIIARVGQGPFRDALMAEWGNACAVSGCTVMELLRASHIRPWASWPEGRLDRHNGLMLVANLDAAFDAHLISFSDVGEMLFAQRLTAPAKQMLSSEGVKLLRAPSVQMAAHLRHHSAEMARLDKAED